MSFGIPQGVNTDDYPCVLLICMIIYNDAEANESVRFLEVPLGSNLS